MNQKYYMASGFWQACAANNAQLEIELHNRKGKGWLKRTMAVTPDGALNFGKRSALDGQSELLLWPLVTNPTNLASRYACKQRGALKQHSTVGKVAACVPTACEARALARQQQATVRSKAEQEVLERVALNLSLALPGFERHPYTLEHILESQGTSVEVKETVLCKESGFWEVSATPCGGTALLLHRGVGSHGVGVNATSTQLRQVLVKDDGSLDLGSMSSLAGHSRLIVFP